MVQLTPVQKNTLNFIQETIETKGVPPTLREIASHFKWKAVGSAQDVVAALRKKGVLVTPDGGKSRQIRPNLKNNSGFHDQHPLNEGFLVPLLGLVQAGLPHEAIEHSSEMIFFPNVPKNNFKRENFFALTVEGFSMLNAGFLPGDIILVESIKTASDREIVVANVNTNEVTVKRFAKKGSSFYKETQQKLNANLSPPAFLIPENPIFHVLPFGTQEEDRIIGVVRSLFRKTIL